MCPNPQNCSAMYRTTGATIDAWEQTDAVAANALVRTSNVSSRGFGGKVAIDSRTNRSGVLAMNEWRWSADAPGTIAVTARRAVPVTGLPAVYGSELTVVPTSVRLPDGNWLAMAYGATLADVEAGSGNRTCVGLFHWQAHFCARIFVLASATNGDSWQYRSSLTWDPEMGKAVGGPSEGALTLLADGSLLAVFRVEQHENLWQSVSSTGGRTWGAPTQTNAWSVFPQLRTLSNGATVLVSGRPGLGMWLLEDAAAARWRYTNLAAAHNAACAGGCGVNSTYDAFTVGIRNATVSVVDGRPVRISAWRWTHRTTPPMTKARSLPLAFLFRSLCASLSWSLPLPDTDRLLAGVFRSGGPRAVRQQRRVL